MTLGDGTCMPTVAFYFIISGIWSSDTKGASHFRFENGEIRRVEEETFWEKDPLFKIIAYSSGGQDGKGASMAVPQVDVNAIADTSHSGYSGVRSSDRLERNGFSSQSAYQYFRTSAISCGDVSNETDFDHLQGVAKRFVHPVFPEPDVELLFRKNEFDTLQMDSVEANLIQAVNMAENRLVLFNQVGNFLRIRGDTYRTIECFRSALALSPNNPDVLLNLARVLLNLDYVDDAIYLATRSLDLQPSDRSTWLQHFMLGEILHISGDVDKAVAHFQSVLEQNPSFHPAMLHLKKLGHATYDSSSNLYTVVIITLLCSSVLPYLYMVVIRDPKHGNNGYSRNMGFLRSRKHASI